MVGERTKESTGNGVGFVRTDTQFLLTGVWGGRLGPVMKKEKEIWKGQSDS